MTIREIIERDFGIDAEVTGPDHNGDHAVRAEDGQLYVVYADGQRDQAVGTWEDLQRAGLVA